MQPAMESYTIHMTYPDLIFSYDPDFETKDYFHQLHFNLRGYAALLTICLVSQFRQ